MSREVKLINFLEKNAVDRFILALNGSLTDSEDESELLMPLPLTDYYLGSHFKSYKPSDRTSLRDQISENRNYWLSTLDKHKLKKVTDRLHDILKLEHTFGFKNLLVDVNKLQLLKLLGDDPILKIKICARREIEALAFCAYQLLQIAAYRSQVRYIAHGVSGSVFVTLKPLL